MPIHPNHPVPELPDIAPAAWREASRQLLAKAIGEWCFEDMLKAIEKGRTGFSATDVRAYPPSRRSR